MSIYTNPEADELRIQAHGGGYEYMPYSSSITKPCDCSTNLPTAKMVVDSMRRALQCLYASMDSGQYSSWSIKNGISPVVAASR